MNTVLGLLGIFGIWLTMAMMPIAEYLALTPMQATFLRGLSGVVILGTMALSRKKFITRPDFDTIVVSILFVAATVCLFRSVVAWGSNYMSLFLNLSLVVPLWFAWRRGYTLSLSTWLALGMAVFGTMLTLRVYQGGAFIWEGLVWSLVMLLTNGLFMEYVGKATQKKWNRVFWMSFGLMMAGIPAIGSDFGFGQAVDGFGLFLVLAIFAVSTGVLNFYFTFLAFSNLSAVSASVLVLGVTPSIIISSYLMLGKAMGIDQIVGVALTLLAVLLFGNALRSKKH